MRQMTLQDNHSNASRDTDEKLLCFQIIVPLETDWSQPD